MAVMKANWISQLFFGWPKGTNHLGRDPKRAREIIRMAYEKSGGPSPELKSVYKAYVENERRKRAKAS